MVANGIRINPMRFKPFFVKGRMFVCISDRMMNPFVDEIIKAPSIHRLKRFAIVSIAIHGLPPIHPVSLRSDEEYTLQDIYIFSLA